MFVVVVVFVTSMIKSPLMGIIQHIFVWRLRLLGATNARCFICFLKKFDVEVHFITEEFGCGIWQKTDGSDRWFPECYLLDDTDDDMNYYDTFEQMAEAIEELCGEKPENFEDAEGILSKYDLDEHIFAHEVEYTSLSDF